MFQEVHESLSLFVPTLFLLELAKLLVQTQGLVKSEVAAPPCKPLWGLSPPILVRLPEAHVGTQLFTKALWKSHRKLCSGGSAASGECSCSKHPPTTSSHSPLFWRRSKGGSGLAEDSQEHVFANEMMTQLHILEFSMNVLLVSHFISSTSTVAFACKI